MESQCLKKPAEAVLNHIGTDQRFGFVSTPTSGIAPHALSFFGREHQDAYEAALTDEINPTTVSEQLLTRLVARLAMVGERLDAAGLALDSKSLELEDVLAPSPACHSIAANLIVAVASERREAISRQVISLSKAMMHGLRELQDRIAARRNTAAYEWLEPDPRFVNESACIIYLVRRFRRGDVGCRRCGSTGGGYWIASRAALIVAKNASTTLKFSGDIR